MKTYYNAETKAWRVQFLRYDDAFGKWEFKTELYPNRSQALKAVSELELAPEKYQNISLKRVTGDSK